MILSRKKESMDTKDKNFIPAQTYRTIMDRMPICCVDVVFFNKDKSKTLLCKRNNEPLKGVYFTVGGRLNKNEKLIDCAMRQAKRELGLTLDPHKLFFGGIIEEPHKNSVFENVSYHDIDIFYSYVLDSETIEIKFDDQHDDYKWFNIDINDESIHPWVRERIRQILLK